MQGAELTKSFPGSDVVARAQAGDRDAFAELYEAYFPAIYDFLARLLRDSDEAADVTQDTFLKALRSLSSLRTPQYFRAWIFTIARNAALNRIEARRRLAPLDHESDRGDAADFALVDTRRFADPAEAAAANEAASIIDEATRSLDPRQLSLLDLHLRQGLTAAEIAEVLGVSRNNAAVMLHRLREAIRRAIEAAYLAKRPACPRLAAALTDVALPLTPSVQRIIEKHADRCPECDGRRKKLAPLVIFSALAPIEPPTGLARQVFATLAEAADAVAEPAGESFVSDEAPMDHRRASLAAAILAAVASLFGLVAFVPGSPISVFRTGLFDGPPGLPAALPFIPSGSSPTPTPTTAPPTPSPSPRPPPSAASTSSAGLAGQPTPTPTPWPPTPTPTPEPTFTPTPTPTASPAPTATVCVPILGVRFADGGPVVLIGPGTSWRASVRVVDEGGCGFIFEATVEAGGSWLSVDPGTGSVVPPGEVVLELIVEPAQLPGTGEGLFTGLVRVDAGSAGSQPFEVQVTNIGGAPRIDSATAKCEPSEGFVAVFVVAVDDFGVVSGHVTVGQSSAKLDPVGEDMWVALVPITEPVPLSGIATVYDGAGQSGQRGFSLSCTTTDRP